MKNCLDLIDLILDKTEKKGIGQIKPHGSLVKGNIILRKKIYLF